MSRSRSRERQRSTSANRRAERAVKRERSSSKRKDDGRGHRNSHKREAYDNVDGKVKSESFHRRFEERKKVSGHSNDSDATGPKSETPFKEKEKPNFEPSGLLAAETNQVNGVVLKVS